MAGAESQFCTCIAVRVWSKLRRWLYGADTGKSKSSVEIVLIPNLDLKMYASVSGA